ncbi:MAG: ClpXP protease specificity-enhancing factor SspB [Hyphomonadaceae bacterium]|nr:ClpXP protease specificity-enhancing factor SspB [Hyphomonadaceae bacterium]
MAEDLIGYESLTQDAMRGVVRAALSRAAAQRALPGKHHFYITFRTHAPGVVIPEHLSARYPDEMTIVLEHQFWDLEVFPDRFRVILKFGGQPSPIVIPFLALTRFYDPSVRFGLQFDQQTAEPVPSAPEETRAVTQAAVGEERETRAPAAQASVVSLDAFRKK